jgi:RNA polymerase sigma factor (sigma-70 family)
MIHHNLQQGQRASDGPNQFPGPRPTSSDPAELERIVAAAARSSSWAWTALVDRFGARVRSVARRHGLSTHDVDDVAQATWMSLFEHIDEIREARAIGSWLATTARRESLRVLGSKAREQPTEDERMDRATIEPVNEQRLVAVEQRSALHESLARLTERQSALMRALLTEPAPGYEQLSQALGMPLGSIGPTKIRSLERLRIDASLAAWCET